MTAVHLHRDDCPETLRLLAELVGVNGRPGFERTKEGAFIDWDELIPGTFSTSEVAVAHIAHGLAVLEAHGGGAPPRLRAAITKAMEAVT